MQTEIKKLDGLKRVLTVTLPEEEVRAAYDKHLRDAAKQIKMPGFRPGKVPLDVIEKKYGSGLRNEVAGELMQSSFEKAVEQNQLQIAGQPHVHPKELIKDAPFEYEAEFEVYPEIALKDLGGQAIEKFASEVTDQDVDAMLGKIQRQQAEWASVERASQEGDRLLMDFVGSIDKETFEGGTAKDFTLELGSKQMIPGFEDALVGLKAGEKKTISVTFPEDYHASNLAGKPAEFEVTVSKVEEPKLPALDDDLAKKVGLEGGLEKLKAEVRSGMERELKQAIEARTKMEVLDKLIELNPIEVPTAFLDLEVKNLQQVTLQQMLGSMGKGHEKMPDIDLPKEPYIEQAKKRVTLGLLLGEVIKHFKIEVDGAKVRERVEEIASAYQKPKEVVEWYYSNNQMLAEVEALVIEEAAVAKLLEDAEVSIKSSTYEEVVNAKK